MWNETQKEALLNVCKKHYYQNAENVIVPEPYRPYMPENWNGILVLAESQNISPGDEYDKWLNELKTEPGKLMTRLEQIPYKNKPDWIGVGPWDDGTVKLALQAIFEGANLDLKFEDVAVSNAVPWTYKSVDKNLNPDDEMQTKNKMEAKAAEFWEEIFDVWQPDIKALLVLGNVAKSVMELAGVLREKYLKLRLPSPNVIDRVRGMFCCDDLEENRFPEVKKAREYLEAQGYLEEGQDKNKRQIFFACHAVSLGVPKFKEWFGEVK